MADPFVTHDKEFAAVLGDAPRLTKVVDADAHEGPVYAADEDALYLTSNRPEVAILRIALRTRRVSVVRPDANMANGMAMGRDGRLLICEQGSRSRPARIAALDRFTGTTETVVDSWRGQPLNSPNDVVVRRDGTIWFTDPSYGWLQGFRPEPQLDDVVHRYDPATGQHEIVADGFDKPNGLAFSPDEQVLYIGDSGDPHHVEAFDVRSGRLRGRRLFEVTYPGFPDGLKVDTEGRVYASASSGVQAFTPDGDLLGEITLPGAVNFAFGGAAGNVLYVTTDTAVWAATLAARGI